MDIYSYQRLVGKIEDIAGLRNEFIAVFDTKSKNETARFGLMYARHIFDVTGFGPDEDIRAAFDAVQRWIDGKTSYHEARNITFRQLYADARETKEIIRKKFFQIMAQISCIPHVKAHALWASDFAVTLINKLYPDNMDEVKKEREIQIKLLKTV